MALFSKKNKPLPDVFQTDELPSKLRRQILWILSEQLPQGEDHLWSLVRTILCKEHGLLSLSNKRDHREDLHECIGTNPDVSLVLDAVQLLFQILSGPNCPFYSTPERAIAELNRFFLESGVGYEFDVDAKELIPFDSKVLHQEAVRPALHLLADPKFAGANKEYLHAFEHFKHGRYSDCLTDCCCALESTMKVILTEKRWPFDAKATALPLLKTYLQHSGMDGFWEQPIIVLATLRSRFGAHGAGAKPHNVPQHLARYALNATGSVIVLLIDAVK